MDLGKVGSFFSKAATNVTNTVQKAASTAQHALEEKLGHKPPPIPDDELAPKREELEDYQKSIDAVQFELENFKHAMKTVSEMQAAKLHNVIMKTKQPLELEEGATRYAETYLQIVNDRHAVTGLVDTLEFDLKSKCNAIDKIRKALESRDRKHKEVADLRAKLAKQGAGSSATQAGSDDPPKPEGDAAKRLEELQAKLTALEEEFNAMTTDLKSELTTLLDDRGRFTSEKFAEMIEVTTKFYTQVVAALNELKPTVQTLKTIDASLPPPPPPAKDY
eukprot:GDKI01046867.1.p1 GENE.GDKI01046867.1~~GDKI01046867.1.p1  ORF type:complete len:277 (-),score=80.25 GDKI01046867.1:330-1160(-)